MANFSTVTVTDLGRQLINSAIGAEQTVSIVNAKVGSGYPDAGQDPADFTDVLNFQMYATETSSNDQVSYQTTIRLAVSSANAPVSFQINEIGIFAQIGTETPILFAYASTVGDGDTITPDPGPDPAIYDYCFLIQYEGDAPVEATITMQPVIQLHGATHRGNNVDPIALADNIASGLLGPLPGDGTKVLLGSVPQTFGPIPKHAPTHLDNGTDPIPVATVARTGLLVKLSGNVSDSLAGDGTWNYKGLPSGVILDYGGDIAPTGFLLCDGSAQSRTAFPGLFAAIGTKYGPGDGSTTFNLPDGRGRASIGAGQGTGLTPRTIGQTGGEEAHTLTGAEMAAHTHTVTDPGHLHTVTDPGHDHTLNDPGHSHTASDGSGHNHTVNDPKHGHTLTDPGHGHVMPWETNEDLANLPPGWTDSGTDYTVQVGSMDINRWLTTSNENPNHTGISIVTALTGISLALAHVAITVARTVTGIAVNAANTGITIARQVTGISINPTTGGNGAHNNMEPFFVCNKIISI